MAEARELAEREIAILKADLRAQRESRANDLEHDAILTRRASQAAKRPDPIKTKPRRKPSSARSDISCGSPSNATEKAILSSTRPCSTSSKVTLRPQRLPTYLASRVTLERLGVCQCVGPLVVGAGDLSASQSNA
jgi:hypothetical protein